MARLPDNAYLIIIGAMKSGTSALFSLLAQHPAICACPTKEPEYFSRQQIHGLRPHQKPAHYGDLWPDFDPGVHRYALEASTGYSKFPRETGVPEAMARAGIRPTLLYLLRNPFDRVESQFNFARVTGLRDPHAAITDDRYVDFSRYGCQLDRYRAVFPREALHVLDFAELAADPQALVDRLCATLGLPPVILDLTRMVRHATPVDAGTVRLTAAERAALAAQLAGDWDILEREYGFDTGAWRASVALTTGDSAAR